MLTFGSLFAGIGGFDLGFERAGLECKWQVEIDDYCQRVLARHWPDVERFGDVRECGKGNLRSVDVICGGFPCQDISNAGKRAGITGQRSGLWSEFARIIRELRPRYVVVENVAALLGRGMGTVLGDLAQSGYDAEWDCIPTGIMWGHRRERIFIVAHTNSNRLETNADNTLLCEQTIGTRNSRYSRSSCSPTLFQGEPFCSTVLFEPNSLRGDNGIPREVDRLKALGNAVVPQVVEWIAHRIIEVENGYS